ncbi:Nop14-like protein [Niveomyces insectorum RCEF 264]|uniref:Nop14-like protein n=1 Tax=Niveomyces insectorum RCEF 264 TaxID=1081102 RepID=A0A167WE55_9HYPO|nr:Nop14-like protein [Niveomyces insectorum RCEF 264]
MAGSQLKRLKASLRDQGIVGPQKSKKQKKKAAEEARAKGTEDKRLRRSAALETIREQFNPFQFKMNARGPKFPVTSLRTKQGEGLPGIKGRPALALSRSEEKRRNTLLIDMQRRNKVGGILDRRLGEGDPNMTPEERALERFTFEKQRIHSKKGAVFDLEDDVDDGGGLTHMGRSLGFGAEESDGAPLKDDFDEDDLEDLDEDEDGDGESNGMSLKQLKRMRSEVLGDGQDDGDVEGAGGPERKKSKKEVMEEVIAKSKFYKFERQQAREADDDVRAELDNMLPELQQLLASQPLPPKKGVPPAKTSAGEQQAQPPSQAVKATALSAQIDRDTFEKAYDVRLRQLLLDKKAEPTTRTKTDEELAEEQSAHLKMLEESRVRRMLGQIEPDGSDSDDEREGGKKGKKGSSDLPQNSAAVQIIREGADDEDEFQLGQGIRVRHTAADLGFDDEDDFLIDDDLVASGSEVESDEEDSDDSDGGAVGADETDSDDDEFTKGLLTEEEKRDPLFAQAGQKRSSSSAAKATDDDGVPYTFPCPQSHADLLAMVRDSNIPVAKLPVVVQRIRALYHPKLDHGNKDRLGGFAAALVEHVAYLGDQVDAPYATIESLVRHIHSLAKTVPIPVANAFRAHLAAMEGAVVRTKDGGEKRDDAARGHGPARPLAFTTGDLVVLTAVTLFPTSDHFHQVVTPAMLAMARYLAQKIPHSLPDYATGLYVCTLFCQYQQFSKRYVPELVNFVLNTLLALAPVAYGDDDPAVLRALLFPVHAPAHGVRVADAQKVAIRKLQPADCRAAPATDGGADANDHKAAVQSRQVALLRTALAVLAEAASLWSGLPSLVETLAPVRAVLQHLRTPACRAQLPAALNHEVDRLAGTIAAVQQVAHLARRPLQLHHHRPLPIRMSVPRFEDEYDPDKHYDPNRERAEAAKLQAEFKRERKGALRELRKDAGFLAREKLKVKKAQDAAYEKKYKRLVAEIQGSEGREANAYERERQNRKRR